MSSNSRQCRCGRLKQIMGFDSLLQFNEFEAELARAVREGALKQVPVAKPLSLLDQGERWFECECGETWRLVGPRFPFRGIFRQVQDATEV
ncbi:MAG: hypothetical protein JWN24_3809 [Phycisphaerales bacterium]|nr:hypothetical protein [Phycisphaerales bacterium]